MTYSIIAILCLGLTAIAVEPPEQVDTLPFEEVRRLLRPTGNADLVSLVGEAWPVGRMGVQRLFPISDGEAAGLALVSTALSGNRLSVPDGAPSLLASTLAEGWMSWPMPFPQAMPDENEAGKYMHFKVYQPMAYRIAGKITHELNLPWLSYIPPPDRAPAQVEVFRNNAREMALALRHLSGMPSWAIFAYAYAEHHYNKKDQQFYNLPTLTRAVNRSAVVMMVMKQVGSELVPQYSLNNGPKWNDRQGPFNLDQWAPEARCWSWMRFADYCQENDQRHERGGSMSERLERQVLEHALRLQVQRLRKGNGVVVFLLWPGRDAEGGPSLDPQAPRIDRSQICLFRNRIDERGGGHASEVWGGNAYWTTPVFYDPGLVAIQHEEVPAGRWLYTCGLKEVPKLVQQEVVVEPGTITVVATSLADLQEVPQVTSMPAWPGLEADFAPTVQTGEMPEVRLMSEASTLGPGHVAEIRVQAVWADGPRPGAEPLAVIPARTARVPLAQILSWVPAEAVAEATGLLLQVRLHQYRWDEGRWGLKMVCERAVPVDMATARAVGLSPRRKGWRDPVDPRAEQAKPGAP